MANKVEEKDWEIVADFQAGGYEWQAAEVARDGHGKYWIRTGSGCSCNDISEVAWEPLRNITQVRTYIKALENSGDASSDEIFMRQQKFIAEVQGLIGRKKS